MGKAAPNPRPNRPAPNVDIRALKGRARAALPAGHPLRRVLDRTADVLGRDEFVAKLDDWIALLEE